MSIDHRHVYGIMLDTETANTLDDNGKLDMTNVLPYDLGFAVIDSHGRVYEAFSFILSDIFNHEAELMQSAYYADKIPKYKQDIAEGKRIVSTAYEVHKLFCDKCEEYECKFACAHNMRFDLTACNNLQRWTTKSKYRYFFPYGIELWDTMRMANDVICKMPTYRKFCEDNGYLTKNNQCRKTAEILYRFISQQDDFVEEHTGLEDVLIEVEILRYCIRQHKPMRKTLFNPSDRPAPTEFQKDLSASLRKVPTLRF